MKKLPPYGRRLVIPRQTQIVMLYVGNPGCWQAAKRDQFAGQYNHLVLPNVHEANQYLWPVNDCAIVAIDFGNSEPPEIESLITHLAEAGAMG